MLRTFVREDFKAFIAMASLENDSQYASPHRAKTQRAAGKRSSAGSPELHLRGSVRFSLI